MKETEEIMTPTSRRPDIATLTIAALESHGFTPLGYTLGRVGSAVRVEVTRGPALSARLVAATAALQDAGLDCTVQTETRAIVAVPRALIAAA